MGDNAVVEKGVDTVLCTVDELVGNHDVARFDIFSERAATADGDNLFDANGFERIDVSAVGQFRWRDEMPPAVPGKEGNFNAFEGADGNDIAGLAERGIDVNFLDVGHAFYLLKAGSTDDS